MSLLIGLDTTFIRKGSDLDNRASHYIYKEGKCLLIGLNTTFFKKRSVFVNRAGHYIY